MLTWGIMRMCVSLSHVCVFLSCVCLSLMCVYRVCVPCVYLQIRVVRSNEPYGRTQEMGGGLWLRAAS